MLSFIKGNIEWQESPEEMYLGNITRKIKGVHCHAPTEDDVSHLAYFLLTTEPFRKNSFTVLESSRWRH